MRPRGSSAKSDDRERVAERIPAERQQRAPDDQNRITAGGIFHVEAMPFAGDRYTTQRWSDVSVRSDGSSACASRCASAPSRVMRQMPQRRSRVSRASRSMDRNGGLSSSGSAAAMLGYTSVSMRALTYMPAAVADRRLADALGRHE